jgi:hypothetical protein
MNKYFGIYCAQCDVWLIRQEDGYLLFYPAEEIAQAHLNTVAKDWHSGSATVTQFGGERRIDLETSSKTMTLCSALADRRRQEAYRATILRGFQEDRAV